MFTYALINLIIIEREASSEIKFNETEKSLFYSSISGLVTPTWLTNFNLCDICSP
jgi:hypothetical protein